MPVHLVVSSWNLRPHIDCFNLRVDVQLAEVAVNVLVSPLGREKSSTAAQE